MLTTEISEKYQLWLDANEAYYQISGGESEEDPLMSDEQFDELTQELLGFNEPEITDAVTNRIWTKRGMTDAEQVESQMVSLKKVKYESRANVLEILKFLEHRDRLVLGPKLDGIAIKAFLNEPADGFYPVKMVITRGGQDVTDILEFHPDFQFSTNDWRIDTLMVAGELVLPKRLFMDKWSEDSDNPKPYANARNAVPGVLKREPRDLRFIPCTDGVSPLMPLENAANNRLPHIWNANHGEVLANIYEIEKRHQHYKSDAFPYQTDGLVVGYKTDRQEIKQNYVLNMVSVKFKAPTAETTVTEITYTQKKSGALTPVIWFDPTPLDGSMVRKATGYNYNNIKVNHIGIGSRIVITKGGDIIPAVLKVLLRSDKIPMPEVDYHVKGKHLYAVDMQTSTIYKFVLGMRLMQIDGIGETLAEQIGAIVDYDIVRLFDSNNKPDIRAVLGGGKVWEKFEIFYQTKTLGLDMLINLLQFDGCGPVLSKTFANVILGANPSIAGIDKNVLNTVCRGEGFAKIRAAMESLKGYGVKVIKPVEISDESLTYEMSGAPPSGTKADFERELLKLFPNSVHVPLTKTTKYLFVDSLSSGSSKLNRGRKFNIKIITYEAALAKRLN
jgi:NAD-dependent DNA ligase